MRKPEENLPETLEGDSFRVFELQWRIFRSLPESMAKLESWRPFAAPCALLNPIHHLIGHRSLYAMWKGKNIARFISRPLCMQTTLFLSAYLTTQEEARITIASTLYPQFPTLPNIFQTCFLLSLISSLDRRANLPQSSRLLFLLLGFHLIALISHGTFRIFRLIGHLKPEVRLPTTKFLPPKIGSS